MCGIAGFFGTRTVAPASIERMLAALRPRGPDAESVILFNASLKQTEVPAPNGLLSTRLSIIDPRPEANQPMANAAGDVWIAYNGEVYDWASDARTLSAAGFHFRTHSDTEFILHAYEHWGLHFIDRLRGMFALAILDLRQRTVYVIRDRFGRNRSCSRIVVTDSPSPRRFAPSCPGFLPQSARFRQRVSMPTSRIGPYRRREPCSMGCADCQRHTTCATTFPVAISASTSIGGLRCRRILGNPPWMTQSRCAPSRTGRSVCFFLQESTPAWWPVAWRLWGTRVYRRSPRRFRERASMRASTRARPRRISVCRIFRLPCRIVLADDFPRLIADLDEPFADPSSVPMWQLAREATRTSRSFWAAMAATSCLAGINVTPSICVPAGGGE